MTNIVLNERDFAERTVREKDLGNNPYGALLMVSRFYMSEGYSKKETRDNLEKLLLKSDPGVNIVRWQDALDKIVARTGKRSLVEIDEVPITRAEVETIRTADGKLQQRLLFTMLCLAKYGNAVSDTNNNWVNRSDRELFSLANINLTTRRQSLMINELWQRGFIGYSRVVDNININVKFIDDKTEPALLVRDFRNLGNQYMRFCGEHFIECQCCGQVVRARSNRQKYCSACAKETNRTKTVDAMRLLRS